MLFLSDDLIEAPYNKYNINGALLGSSISVSKLPYTLESNIIYLGKLDISVPFSGTLEIAGSLNDVRFSTMREQLNLEELPEAAIFQVPIRVFIQELGTLRLELNLNNLLLSVSEYKIVIGDAPFKNIVDFFYEDSTTPGQLQRAPRHTSGIIARGHQPLVLVEIFASASESLWIIDPYFEPEQMEQLLKYFTAKLDIRILTTKPKAFENIRKAVEEAGHNLEVRKNKKFHDRFIIVNKHDIYHFGHSIKDIYRNKVSRFQKLINKDEISIVIAQAQESWK